MELAKIGFHYFRKPIHSDLFAGHGGPCLQRTACVKVILAEKQFYLQHLMMDEAIKRCSEASASAMGPAMTREANRAWCRSQTIPVPRFPEVVKATKT
jgi:hypothetical protein